MQAKVQTLHSQKPVKNWLLFSVLKSFPDQCCLNTKLVFYQIQIYVRIFPSLQSFLFQDVVDLHTAPTCIHSADSN
jgi:hypothetical protein